MDSLVVPADIFLRVSRSLSNLIRENIPFLQRSEQSVVFDSPAELDGAETKLSLYLYQVETNPYLRNLPETMKNPVVAAGVPPPVRRMVTPAPFVVDLLYMMVPFGTIEYELAMADGLTRVLDRIGAIPISDDVLIETGNSALSIIPEFESIHLLRDLWSLFPQKAFRLTKLYRVSPVRIPSSSPTEVDIVKGIDFRRLDQKKPTTN